MPGVTARDRWLMLVAARLAGTAGAVLGLILIARAHDTTPKVLGVGLVLAALYMTATVPAALAHRWRSRSEDDV